MKWIYAMIICGMFVFSVGSDAFAFDSGGVLNIELQAFDVPSIEECNNPDAHNWYEHAMGIDGVERDQMFTLVHAAWLGLCIKISRKDVTQLEAIAAFDHLLQSFDAARFLVEPFHSVSGKRES